MYSTGYGAMQASYTSTPQASYSGSSNDQNSYKASVTMGKQRLRPCRGICGRCDCYG